MIKIILILLLMASSAFAKDEVKLYDKTGSYIGKTVQQPDKITVKSYDKTGSYTGKTVLQPDKVTVKIYDKTGSYIGKTKKTK
ncbi:MAG: hypothetical protein AB7S77_21465 [Desulfatirhabdiaceae bacterium]